MANENLPSPNELRYIFRYDPESGKLFWRQRDLRLFKNERIGNSWNSTNAGKEAFSLSPDGYMVGGVWKQRMLAHRAIWAICHGNWPQDDIDHIDGNRCNNRLENLRAVTRMENLRNTRLRDCNSSGHVGVSFHKPSGLWRARVSAGGVEVVRYFKEKADAIEARLLLSASFGFHKNHGRASPCKFP